MTRVASRTLWRGRILSALGLSALSLSLWSFTADPAGLAHADESDHEMARKALQDGKVLPLRTVLDRVERDYKGQVLEVELERDDGRYVYEIKMLLSEGNLVKMKVDATDARVIKIKQKRKN